MRIEEEIFQRCKVDMEALLTYGFCKQGNSYLYSTTIMDGTFRVDVLVTEEGCVSGKVYDFATSEEYTSYRLENEVGGFRFQVREAFEEVLKDIRETCTICRVFQLEQANRIMDKIREMYDIKPEFLWEKYPGYGVFRNKDKWFGLIANVSRSKISDEDGEVEILNVKLDSGKIEELLSKKGFYPAYHMNKKNWISIVLDDTFYDEEIMLYVAESYRFTECIREWIVPANPKYYDVIHCFDGTDTILWKQARGIQVGDMVYLYVAAPYSAILYQCSVLEVDIPYTYQDENIVMSKVMKIKLLHRYQETEFPFSRLQDYDIKIIRGPRGIPVSLSEDLKR